MTIRNRKRTGLVGLAAAALAATALTAPAHATTLPVGDHTATQSAIDAAVAAGIPGITAEARDNDGVWKTAAGVADRTTGTPRGKNDRFRVGHITSTFVATALLQMEAEKKLTLDDKIERFLPGVVTGNGNDGKAITVRQLLNHTSGLYDYFADGDYVSTYVLGDGYLQHRFETMPKEKRLQVALSHAPAFAPGARHAFSNTNDLVAAMVLEKAAGRPYEDEIRRRIIVPLGLNATSNPRNATTLPQPSSRAYSKLFFQTQPDRIDDVTEISGSHTWGSDIISSASDLNRFYAALVTGRLLPPAQLAAMKTTVVNPDFPISSFGLGLERLTLGCGTTVWYRDGGTVGWLSLVALTDDGRHQLTFNYNSDWRADDLLAILSAEFCK
ncbi:beta-lactamase family protein [Streptomyces bambusae]|uniref:serine hydrolase domain-containing protein n=1 Tax=Streptomyces bambusae TaxID=1550616 RepID=UPI001CFEA888|nr:serine hydrolase domain-containing protein [Streptomyces bambusae]MCB5165737.1 beta-lactamase family protein [Streptomyces bambusae]